MEGFSPLECELFLLLKSNSFNNEEQLEKAYDRFVTNLQVLITSGVNNPTTVCFILNFAKLELTTSVQSENMILFKVLKLLDIALECVKTFPPSHKVYTSSKEIKTNLKWTAETCNIVEIIYALFHTRCINHGEATIKEITEAFESMFNMKINNTSHTFLRIRGRKREDRASFLNKLHKNFIQAATELDK